jgi:hypothetical protein
MFMKLLWVTGLLSLVAIGVRGSVTAGLYLGVLPGIILAVAPTAFVYLATFATLRMVLPIGPGVLANSAAAVVTALLGVALAVPGALAGRAAFATAATGEIAPAAPVSIVGHIKLDRTGNMMRGKKSFECDALWAALLDTPGVLSVTLAGSSPSGEAIPPLSYRLVAEKGAPSAGLAPDHPEEIVDHVTIPAPMRASGQPDWDARTAATKALRNAVTAKWALKLASGQVLIAKPARTAFDRTIAIRDSSAGGPHRLAVAEVEIRGADGQVLLRRQRVTAEPQAIPLYVAPQGPMLDRGFGIGRRLLHTGERYGGIKPVEILFAETTLARPTIDPGSVDRMRERLAAAIGRPGRAADMAMVGPWLATIEWRQMADTDIDLLARLIQEPGVAGLQRLYDGYVRSVSPRLRRPIAIRLLDPTTDAVLRNNLNDLMRHMPPGTFAEPLPEEDALLHDQGLRLTSSAVIARLADRGASAVPLLTTILQEDARVEPWAKRQWVMADVRRALTRLGPEAAPALPTVERLFGAQRSPLTNSWGDAQAWRVAMVRMGKPIDTLPFPPHFTPENIAEDRENVRRMAMAERDRKPEEAD